MSPTVSGDTVCLVCIGRPTDPDPVDVEAKSEQADGNGTYKTFLVPEDLADPVYTPRNYGSEDIKTMNTTPLLLQMALYTVSISAAGTFVYTNNNSPGANSVSGYSVGVTGALTPLAGSPFANGGNRNGGRFYAAHRNTSSVMQALLYVSKPGCEQLS